MLANSAVKSCGLLNTLLIHGDFCKLPHDFYRKPFDFVFIDGMKSEYLDYYTHLNSVCSPETTLYFDDMIEFEEKTSSLISHLEKNGKSYILEKVSENDGVLITKI